MRTLYLTVLCLVGTASLAHARPTPQVQTSHLVCGSAVRLDVSHDGQSAIARGDDGHDMLLKSAGSKVGNLYKGESMALLIAGDTVIYTDRDGASLSCAPLPR
jgi:hypothetical protein